MSTNNSLNAFVQQVHPAKACSTAHAACGKAFECPVDGCLQFAAQTELFLHHAATDHAIHLVWLFGYPAKNNVHPAHATTG